MFDRTKKRVAELSDAELEAELLRRRRARAERRRDLERPADPTSTVRTPEEQQLAQYFANLELKPGATLDDVRRAYRELMKRYHPDRFVGDAERQKSASELSKSLTRAYDALVTALSRK